jgi:GntR family transcriptional repressor for pyruvate dehydrogenase complex
MKFKAINKRKRIYEEVLDQLQAYLFKSAGNPGQKLPSERELAQMFHVNRFSVREALTVLESNGLVKRKIGEGTFSTGTANFATTSLVDVVARNQHLIKEPMQVRRVIEPQLARLAAVNISDEQLAHMKDVLRQQNERLSNGLDIIDLDSEFHSCIARATKNSIFVGLLEALHDSLATTSIKSNQARGGGKAGYNRHQAIYAALEQHDPDKAEEAMFEHMVEVERLLLDYHAERETKG